MDVHCELGMAIALCIITVRCIQHCVLCTEIPHTWNMNVTNVFDPVNCTDVNAKHVTFFSIHTVGQQCHVCAPKAERAHAVYLCI